MPAQATIDQTMPKYFRMSPLNRFFTTWVRAQKELLSVSTPESLRSLVKHTVVCEDCINYESVIVRVHRNTIVYNQFRIRYDSYDRYLLFNHIEKEMYNDMLQIWILAQKAIFPNIPEIDSHDRFIRVHKFMRFSQITNG